MGLRMIFCTFAPSFVSNFTCFLNYPSKDSNYNLQPYWVPIESNASQVLWYYLGMLVFLRQRALLFAVNECKTCTVILRIICGMRHGICPGRSNCNWHRYFVIAKGLFSFCNESWSAQYSLTLLGEISLNIFFWKWAIPASFSLFFVFSTNS